LVLDGRDDAAGRNSAPPGSFSSREYAIRRIDMVAVCLSETGVFTSPTIPTDLATYAGIHLAALATYREPSVIDRPGQGLVDIGDAGRSALSCSVNSAALAQGNPHRAEVSRWRRGTSAGNSDGSQRGAASRNSTSGFVAGIQRQKSTDSPALLDASQRSNDSRGFDLRIRLAPDLFFI